MSCAWRDTPSLTSVQDKLDELHQRAQTTSAVRTESHRRASACTRGSATAGEPGPQGGICRRLLFCIVRATAYYQVDSTHTSSLPLAAAAPDSTVQAETQTVAPGVSSTSLSRRLFGDTRTAAKQAGQLEQAIAMASARVDMLQSRASDERSEAQRLNASGNRTEAVRRLRKHKQLVAQATETQKIADTLDMQRDMLEQTALQKQVTAAMTTMASSFHKTKRSLAKAESVADTTSDLHDELAHTMSVPVSYTHLRAHETR